jgi:hypothetical protein
MATKGHMAATLYQGPTLFGVAYASRLHRQIDKSSGFIEQLRRKILPDRDLDPQKCSHAKALLKWLNKWGCRITEDSFPKISGELDDWFRKWRQQLPCTGLELVCLQDQHLDVLAAAYHELLGIHDFGPTSASKALFAVRPHAAMPWDAAIQEEFELGGRAPENYRAMLVRSKDEGKKLIDDAGHCGMADPRHNIPSEVGRPEHTLAQLLDEYHWITITRGHEIPRRDELKRWVEWETRSATLREKTHGGISAARV